MENILLILLFVGSAICCDNGYLLRSGKLTSREKQEVVDAHNEFRHCIATGSQDQKCRYLNAESQPTAANMRKMEWDDNLARLAQDWANKCRFQHNKNYDSRFCVGQNLGISMSSAKDSGKPNFRGTIKRWFDEQKDYGYTAHRGNFPRMVGHYTQVVWADTYKVGCGYTYYKQDNWYKKYIVCNYGPCGNFIGQYPYKAGQPACSNYNMRPSNIGGLCEE